MKQKFSFLSNFTTERGITIPIYGCQFFFAIVGLQGYQSMATILVIVLLIFSLCFFMHGVLGWTENRMLQPQKRLFWSTCTIKQESDIESLL